MQSIEDILEEFPLVRGDISTSILPTLPPADNVQLNSSEKAILALLSSMPMSPDELFEATSRPLSEISLLMLSMEMKGFVKLEPTGYVRSR